MVVHRHKTAISRPGYSRPVQLLLSHGLLQETDTFFDYGCGLGEDVERLRTAGYTANGWDPVYFPDTEKLKADIVNLGFVLNVIENRTERREALREAYALTTRVLLISVLTPGSTNTETGTQHGDGIVTSRGTFQKVFEQSELQDFVASVCGEPPLPIAPGIVAAFWDSAVRSDFLLTRVRGRTDDHINNAPQLPRRNVHIKQALLRTFVDEHPGIFDNYVKFLLERGRAPHYEELSGLLTAKEYGVDLQLLHQVALNACDSDTIAKAAQHRREDLVVLLALEMFRETPKLKDLSVTLREDIKYHFNGLKNAVESAREYLFALGDRDLLRRWISESPIGHATHKGLYITPDQLQEIDPILRIYGSLAELFYGDIRQADILKLHADSAKITLLFTEDFENQEFPVIIYRVKIDLSKQEMREYEHSRSVQEMFTCKALLNDNEASYDQVLHANYRVIVEDGSVAVDDPK